MKLVSTQPGLIKNIGKLTFNNQWTDNMKNSLFRLDALVIRFLDSGRVALKDSAHIIVCSM